MRLPVAVPLMMMARAFPLAQPGRFTISWMIAVRSGVRSAAAVSPEVQAAGDQLALAVVSARDDTLFVALANVAALSSACPAIVSVFALLSEDLAVNWM